MKAVFDLLIDNGDLVFGSDDEPEYTTNQAAIAQDLKHRLKESGLLPKLVAARGQENQTTLQQIKLVAKQEERIRPDSVNILDLGEGLSQITARTIDGEFIAVNM